MDFVKFRVYKYRNIEDSDWIDVNKVTAFVGQNEAGKSNLFDALYRVNPFDEQASYLLDEDWPVDDWGNKGKNKEHIVCRAQFNLTPEEIQDLYDSAWPASDDEGEEGTKEEAEAQPKLPKSLTIEGRGYYHCEPTFWVIGNAADDLDHKKLQKWAKANVPKFVYIHDYEMSGTQIELNQLKKRHDELHWEDLTNEEQTILIVLELAQIDLDEFIEKGQSQEGRTTRSFDKKQASAYLTRQFSELWSQKDVRFDIDVDGTTLNIFVEDEGLGMPVRLSRRSTGFRWYVSFAWKFTHASGGEYEDCILLLEEPGVHLHYDGQKDLIEVFERLSENNTILYTTHLASMVNLGFPERVRIVESKDKHVSVKAGVVSSQRAPMAVIELSLGLTGDMSGLLGNRQSLIVEGGDDSLILQKLSALLHADGKTGLSDKIYLWPARGAQKVPMYAAFSIGQGWDSGVLLDTDAAGADAKKKIEDLYIPKAAEATGNRFSVMQIGKAAGIKKTDAAIEDLFPDDFYVDCVNTAYGLGITLNDLPVDGSDMITKRVEHVLADKYSRKLDKRLVLNELLQRFDTWKSVKDLPKGTVDKAESLFKTINAAFDREPANTDVQEKKKTAR